MVQDFESIISPGFVVSLRPTVHGLRARVGGAIITVAGMTSRYCSVLRMRCDCSNGGVTSHEESILCLFDTEIHGQYDDIAARGVLVPVFFEGKVQMATLHSLRFPNNLWMDGGNCVRGDSSWPFSYPVPVHDRQEYWNGPLD